MADITNTMIRSRSVMPISGHQCALGTTDLEAAIVRDRVFGSGLVLGTTPAYAGVFPGPDAWSPPI